MHEKKEKSVRRWYEGKQKAGHETHLKEKKMKILFPGERSSISKGKLNGGKGGKEKITLRKLNREVTVQKKNYNSKKERSAKSWDFSRQEIKKGEKMGGGVLESTTQGV